MVEIPTIMQYSQTMQDNLMNMVQQIENMPDEVLELVNMRKQKQKKEQEKLSREQTEQLDNFLQVAQSMQIDPQTGQQLAQAGSIGDNPLNDLLGAGIQPNLGI